MKKAIGFVLLFLTAGSAAWAGNRVGNGGGAWVCRDGNGRLRSSELVDLYEAENEFGLKIAPFAGSTGDIVKTLLPRVGGLQSNLNLIATYIDRLQLLQPNPPVITYTDQKLEIINDALYVLRPTSSFCPNGNVAFEQVVDYQDDGTLLVQRELFNSLSATHQAALVFHEAIYASFRALGEATNSVYSRRLVGLIFSTLSKDEINQELRTQSEQSGHLPAGPYDLTVEVLDRDGIYNPLSADSVSVDTPIFSTKTPGLQIHDQAAFSSPGKGLLQISPLTGEQNGPQFEQVVLDGIVYLGSPATAGWATDLVPTAPILSQAEAGRATYSCVAWTEALATPQAPGRLKVRCAPRD